MRNQLLIVDAGIAIILAILLIVFSPGVAVTGMLALLVLAVCAVSPARSSRRRRRRGSVELRRAPR
ncbi:MAG: hypothetical protein JO153_10985 [Solirubrobacterales bacterium]|nr:hypothetical protein [Solirubrobacterales bacterium]MBV9917014.1 hypothetical protein [Solirubrobacterales bacterium]